MEASGQCNVTAETNVVYDIIDLCCLCKDLGASLTHSLEEYVGAREDEVFEICPLK